MDKGPNDWSDGKHPVAEDFWDEYNENNTFNYSDMVTSDGDLGTVCGNEIALHFEAVFIPVLYSLALVVGLLGNGLLLWVLVKRRRDWSVTDTFILHLAVADTLLLVTLPFWAAQSAQEKGWSFGTPLCKIIGAIFTINFYCGIFLLACISMDRYLSIVHAAQMFSRRKAWLVHSSCLSVWLLSILLSIPDWVFLQAVEDDRRGNRIECIRNYHHFSQSTTEWRLGSRLLYHIVGFLLPSAVLIFCYASILMQLQRGSKGLQKQRAVRVILALVVVFFLCWTPYNITLMMDTLQSNISLSTLTCSSRTSLEKAVTVTSTLGYIHCSLNPVLYAFVGIKFRRQLLGILRSLGCRLKSSVTFKSTAGRRNSLWSESGDTSNSIAI